MGLPAPPMYFGRDGEPIGLGDWAYLRDAFSPHVAETRVDDAWVSTVWLGLDHGFGIGPPLIFETMIFGGPLDQYQARYHDEAEALDGHLVAVALAQSVPLWRRLAWIVRASYEQAGTSYLRDHVWRHRWPEAPLWRVSR
jgi:hypothetical protein